MSVSFRYFIAATFVGVVLASAGFLFTSNASSVPEVIVINPNQQLVIGGIPYFETQIVHTGDPRLRGSFQIDGTRPQSCKTDLPERLLIRRQDYVRGVYVSRNKINETLDQGVHTIYVCVKDGNNVASELGAYSFVIDSFRVASARKDLSNNVHFTFNQPVNPKTINTRNVLLTYNSSVIPGTVRAVNFYSFVFTPSVELGVEKGGDYVDYEFIVTNRVRSFDNIALDQAYSIPGRQEFSTTFTVPHRPEAPVEYVQEVNKYTNYNDHVALDHGIVNISE